MFYRVEDEDGNNFGEFKTLDQARKEIKHLHEYTAAKITLNIYKVEETFLEEIKYT